MDTPEDRHVLGEVEERTGSHPGHEEEHHAMKSVLKKVKGKAKKIKETIGKMKHEHGEEHHRNDEEEEEEGYSKEEEKEEDPEVHGGPMYESEAAPGFVASREEAPPEEGVQLGAAPAGNLEEDAGTPKIGTEAPPVPGKDQSTGLPSAGEPEPGLIRSFQAMSTEDGPKKEEEKTTKPSPEESPAAAAAAATTLRGEETQTASRGETEQLQPQSEMSYKEKISSALVDKAVHAKDAAVSAAVESAEYGKKIAETMYEKMTRGGPDAAAPPPQQQVAKEKETHPSGAEGARPPDKWVSVKEYLAEKLNPGEEDRALCQVISETIQKRREDERDIREEAEEKPTAAAATAATPSGEEKSRNGVVGKIKGAVAFVFGGPYSSQTRTREEATPSSQDVAPRLQESTN